MKKSLTAIAVAAVMAAPLAANADATVYGKVNVALENSETFGTDNGWSLDYSSGKGSNVGVKGSNDTNLMDFSAVYKAEIGFSGQTGTGGTLSQRDMWAGLSSNTMGTVRAGTIKSSYKASGGMIDPFWDTAAQGRGALEIMSGLHGGTGDVAGRRTNNVQYVSPNLAGAKVIVDYTFAAGANNFGLGVHYKNGPILAFLDYASFGDFNTDDNGKAVDATATKVGGKYSAGDFSAALQYEIDGGAISGIDGGKANTMFFNAAYAMGATTLSLSYGMQDESDSGNKDDHTGWAVGAVHAVAKTSAIYVAYGNLTGSDGYNASTNDDATIMAIGMQQAF